MRAVKQRWTPSSWWARPETLARWRISAAFATPPSSRGWCWSTPRCAWASSQTCVDALYKYACSLLVHHLITSSHVVVVPCGVRKQHTMLAGDQATSFARENGLPLLNLTTSASASLTQTWIDGHCQPNFRKDVTPDPSTSCGPYVRSEERARARIGETRFDKKSAARGLGRRAHDTIAVFAKDASGSFAGATSTNGAAHKIPGRVGDAPIAVRLTLMRVLCCVHLVRSE